MLPEITLPCAGRAEQRKRGWAGPAEVGRYANNPDAASGSSRRLTGRSGCRQRLQWRSPQSRGIGVPAGVGVAAHRDGRGVARDYGDAVRWFRRSAAQGHARGETNLGRMYATGRGVTRDDAEAVRWYRRAAEQGYALGENNLGVMYRDGRGVARDYGEAVAWFRRSAEQGNAAGHNAGQPDAARVG